MRCKPDDLARIVDSEFDPLEPWAVKYKGLIVLVIRRSEEWKNSWITSLRTDDRGFPVCFADSHLMPIRPPEEPVIVGQLTDITERV